MKEKPKPLFVHQLQSLIINETALNHFLDNCNQIAFLIVETGTAATITDSTARRREHLALPRISGFDSKDMKKLASITRLRRSPKETT
jgi:hypothetical protein